MGALGREWAGYGLAHRDRRTVMWRGGQSFVMLRYSSAVLPHGQIPGPFRRLLVYRSLILILRIHDILVSTIPKMCNFVIDATPGGVQSLWPSSAALIVVREELVSGEVISYEIDSGQPPPRVGHWF